MGGTPWTTEYSHTSQGIWVIRIFSEDGQEFTSVLTSPDNKATECGSWPSISAASSAAKEKVAVVPLDPLMRWRSDPDNCYMVMFDGVDRKFSVIVGDKRRNRFVDTGLRYPTREEALGVVGGRLDA
jgi:hypothetical protein